MFIKKIFFLFSIFLLFSCKQVIENTPADIDFSITSPKTNWIYYENTKIMLAVNVDTEDIEWVSNISGHLGTGNHIALFLAEGIHKITANIKGVKKEKQVYVFAIDKNIGTQTTLINYSPLRLKIKKGYSHSYLSGNEGSITNFIMPLEQTLPVPGPPAYTGKKSFVSLPSLQRDIRIIMPKTRQRIFRRPVKLRQNIVGERTFTVINTGNQYLTPHQIEAKLCYSSDTLSVWIPVSYTPDILRDDFLETIEKVIIPRITTVFGKHEDINGDGTLAILLSPTLNEEKAAIGFFNPADFFQKNNDPASESYNPHSNEMDIIYAAIPEYDSGSSYSVQTVLATIAHELTHASTFTVKTWNRIKQGDSSAAREELFLDEGWSHLAENLCGFGVSGGNIRFLERFFGDTSMYSFCGTSRVGQEDSAGMRGAITLFLSWLFWKAGGMMWDETNSVDLIDTGGISFLQSMLALPTTGWDSIGLAFGRPVSTLFNEMLEEMNYYRANNTAYSYRTDPLTGEAVDFFVNMGVVHTKNIIDDITIGFPKLSLISSHNSLPPWAVVYFESFYAPADGIITMYSDKSNGTVYYSGLSDKNRSTRIIGLGATNRSIAEQVQSLFNNPLNRAQFLVSRCVPSGSEPF